MLPLPVQRLSVLSDVQCSIGPAQQNIDSVVVVLLFALMMLGTKKLFCDGASSARIFWSCLKLT